MLGTVPRPVIDRSKYSTSMRGGSKEVKDNIPLSPLGEGRDIFSASTTCGVEQIKPMLGKMNKKQRKEIIDYCLLLNQASKNPDYDRQLEMWIDSCCQVLKELLPGSAGFTHGSVKLRELAVVSHQQILAFIEEADFKALAIHERKGLYDWLAKILGRRSKHLAAKTTAPLSLRLIFQQTPDIAGLFDSSFPGYLAGGKAYLIIEQLGIRYKSTQPSSPTRSDHVRQESNS